MRPDPPRDIDETLWDKCWDWVMANPTWTRQELHDKVRELEQIAPIDTSWMRTENWNLGRLAA